MNHFAPASAIGTLADPLAPEMNGVVKKLFALLFRQTNLFANARCQAVQFEAPGLPFVQGKLASHSVVREILERDGRSQAQAQIRRAEARTLRDNLHAMLIASVIKRGNAF